MGIVAAYTVEMQTTRKILTVVDNSAGWNDVGFELAKFCKFNTYNNTVILNILIETRNKTYSKSFILTTYSTDIRQATQTIYAMFGSVSVPMSDKADLKYHVAISITGDLVLISANESVDGYDVLPDGIYTIDYLIYNNSAVATSQYNETFVVTNGGDQVVLNAANKIADEVLTCTKPNLGNISDYLLQEALLFAANKAALISRKDRILNILSVLNS